MAPLLAPDGTRLVQIIFEYQLITSPLICKNGRGFFLKSTVAMADLRGFILTLQSLF